MQEFVFSLTKVFLPYAIGMLIICGLVTLFLINRNKRIGKAGEQAVMIKLNELPKETYRILNDVMIDINNVTHQIDHIVVSIYGIFVIETKCYQGMIVGNEADYYWYQYLGRKKYKIRNPIHQNYGHVKAISEALNIIEKDIVPIVCFTNQSELKINTNSIVVQRKDLINKILELSIEDKNVDIGDVYNKLCELNITDKEKREQHVLSAKQKEYETTRMISEMICPKCGGQLLHRNGKYGMFIGCSNYPKCKFTQK